MEKSRQDAAGTKEVFYGTEDGHASQGDTLDTSLNLTLFRLDPMSFSVAKHADVPFESLCNGGLLAPQSDLVSPPPPSLSLISPSSSCRPGNLLIHTVNDGAVQICALRDARQVHVVRTTPLKEIFDPRFDVNQSGISTVSIFFFYYYIELVSIAVQSRISADIKCKNVEKEKDVICYVLDVCS